MRAEIFDMQGIMDWENFGRDIVLALLICTICSIAQ